MALLAMALPLVPDQVPHWRAWIEELQGPRRAEFVASRREAGVRERTFLQTTPLGDLVIVTFEGDDPLASLGKLLGGDDAFTRWFVENASAAHGTDLSQPMSESPSTLMIDSEGEPGAAPDTQAGAAR